MKKTLLLSLAAAAVGIGVAVSASAASTINSTDQATVPAYAAISTIMAPANVGTTYLVARREAMASPAKSANSELVGVVLTVKDPDADGIHAKAANAGISTQDVSGGQTTVAISSARHIIANVDSANTGAGTYSLTTMLAAVTDSPAATAYPRK